MATTITSNDDGTIVDPPNGDGVSSIVANGTTVVGAAAGGVVTTVLESYGCIAFWPLDEGSGTTATDVVGGADGTLNGATWGTELVTGAGAAASFDGVDDFIDVVDVSSLVNQFGNDQFSLELTINHADAGATAKAIALRDHNSTEMRLFTQTGTTNSIQWDLYPNNGNKSIYYTTPPARNTTHHLILTWNGTTGNMKAYKDGVNVSATGDTTTALGPLNDSTYERLVIGCDIDGPGTSEIDFFEGRISHVGIYNRELNTSEITDRYNNRAPN